MARNRKTGNRREIGAPLRRKESLTPRGGAKQNAADCLVVYGGVTTAFKPLNGSIVFLSMCISLTVMLWRLFGRAVPHPPYSIAFTFTSTAADVYEPPADVRATCCSLAFVARCRTLAFRHRRRRSFPRILMLFSSDLHPSKPIASRKPSADFPTTGELEIINQTTLHRIL